MAPKSKFDDDMAIQAFRLYLSGQTYRQIGQHFGLSRQTASKAAKRGRELVNEHPQIVIGLTTDEVRERLNLSLPSVIYHIRTGTLKSRKIGGKLYIDEESVNNFKPLEREGEQPGAGRPTNIERGLPEPVTDRGKLSIYLGQNISLEEIAQIRKLISADLRARILLRLAYLAENELENFRRALESIGVDL